MKQTRQDRRSWIEARNSVVEALVQAHIAAPTLSLREVVERVDADPKILNAALNHSFAKNRLPRSMRPRSKQELLADAGERLLTHLAAEISFPADLDTLAALLEIDTEDCSSVIKALAEKDCIIATAGRALRPRVTLI